MKREAAWYIIVAPYVCLRVCLTCKSLEIGSSFLHILHILMGYRSSLYMKVISSQEEKSSKIFIPAM